MLRSLPDEHFHVVCTSPPYYNLRNYSTNPQIWGESGPCDHVWGPWQEQRTLRHTDSERTAGKMRHSDRSWGDDPTRTFDGQHQRHVAAQTCIHCGAMRCELGNEPTIRDYTSHLVEVFREVWRVLHPTGLLFVNLGDSYARNPAKGQHRPGQNGRCSRSAYDTGVGRSAAAPCDQDGVKEKDLCLVPARFAIAMVEDGWYLRNDCIWHKPNAKPASVTDRFVMDHEYVFMFARSSKYYFDWMAVAEPHKTSESDQKRHKYLKTRNQAHAKAVGNVVSPMRDSHGGLGFSEAGRRRRTVWSITTKSFKDAHFAVFAPELPEICLRAGTSEGGCCVKCGVPLVRVTTKGEPDRAWQAACGGDDDGQYTGVSQKDYVSAGAESASDVKRRILEGMRPKLTLGWALQCKCWGDPPRTEFPRPRNGRKRQQREVSGSWRKRVERALAAPAGAIVPCRVLDPFAGSGTVGEVAHELHLDCTLVELQPDYVPLIHTRVGKVGGTVHDVRLQAARRDLVAALEEAIWAQHTRPLFPPLVRELWEDLDGLPMEDSGWAEDEPVPAFSWSRDA